MTKTIQVRVTPEVLKGYKAAAKRDRRVLSDWIRYWLEMATDGELPEKRVAKS